MHAGRNIEIARRPWWPSVMISLKRRKPSRHYSDYSSRSTAFRT